MKPSPLASEPVSPPETYSLFLKKRNVFGNRLTLFIDVQPKCVEVTFICNVSLIKKYKINTIILDM